MHHHLSLNSRAHVYQEALELLVVKKISSRTGERSAGPRHRWTPNPPILCTEKRKGTQLQRFTNKSMIPVLVDLRQIVKILFLPMFSNLLDEMKVTQSFHEVKKSWWDDLASFFKRIFLKLSNQLKSWDGLSSINCVPNKVSHRKLCFTTKPLSNCKKSLPRSHWQTW